MKKTFLVTLKNKDMVGDLKKYGNIVYISDYTNLVSIECSASVIDSLKNDPNVIEVGDALTGSLQ